MEAVALMAWIAAAVAASIRGDVLAARCDRLERERDEARKDAAVLAACVRACLAEKEES